MKKGIMLTLGATAITSACVLAGAVSNPTVVRSDATDVYSGSIIIQKNDNDIKNRGKWVAYLFGASGNGWSEPIVNDGNTYQEYRWSVSIEPTTIIILNVNNDWDPKDPWTNPLARTGNISLSNNDVVWMTKDASEGGQNSNWGSFDVDARVIGGASDDWSVSTIDTALTNVKTDGNKIEAYGLVNLPANTYFKTVKEYGQQNAKWYGSFTCLPAISTNLGNSYSGNIHNIEAAKYEFYFDYENGTTYITDPVVAEADEWAQSLLSSGANACDNTRSNWGSLAASYESNATKYGSDFSSIFENAEHYGHTESPSGFVNMAMQRYDYVLERFGQNNANTDELGYEDFIGRVEKGKVTPKALGSFVNNLGNSNFNIAPIVALAAAGTVLLAGSTMFILRKKKEN